MTPILEHWFSLSIRRERKSFIFASVLLYVVLLLIFLFIWNLGITESTKGIITFIFFGLGIFASYTLTAQRLRDMNLTGWLALLWIPISFVGDDFRLALFLAFSLILWTVPGTDGENRYGSRINA